MLAASLQDWRDVRRKRDLRFSLPRCHWMRHDNSEGNGTHQCHAEIHNEFTSQHGVPFSWSFRRRIFRPGNVQIVSITILEQPGDDSANHNLNSIAASRFNLGSSDELTTSYTS